MSCFIPSVRKSNRGKHVKNCSSEVFYNSSYRDSFAVVLKPLNPHETLYDKTVSRNRRPFLRVGILYRGSIRIRSDDQCETDEIMRVISPTVKMYLYSGKKRPMSSTYRRVTGGVNGATAVVTTTLSCENQTTVTCNCYYYYYYY